MIKDSIDENNTMFIELIKIVYVDMETSDTKRKDW